MYHVRIGITIGEIGPAKSIRRVPNVMEQNKLKQYSESLPNQDQTRLNKKQLEFSSLETVVENKRLSH